MVRFMDFMTISQAAKSIGVSRAALYKAIDSGRLMTIEIMGRSAITRAELKRFKSERAERRKNGKTAK